MATPNNWHAIAEQNARFDKQGRTADQLEAFYQQRYAANKAAAAAVKAAQRNDQALQNTVKAIAKENAPPKAGHNRRTVPIIWDGESKCFSDLRYSNGQVFATFLKDGSQYAYPMSRSDAKEWLVDNADQTGEFFNEFVR